VVKRSIQMWGRMSGRREEGRKGGEGEKGRE
jgi:hypothetical protein